MATGWQMLGDALAGPPPQNTLRTAQTELALIKAAEARDKLSAQRGLSGADPTKLTPEQQMGMIQSGYGTDYSGVMRGRNLGQEFDFKQEIADPATDMAARQYAAQAVAGKPVNYLDQMGQGGYADIRDPDAGVEMSPLGDALIGAGEALTHQREAAAGANDALKAQRERVTTKPTQSLDEFAVRDEVKRLQGVLNNYDPASGITPAIKAQAQRRLNELLHPVDGSDDQGEPQPEETPPAAPAQTPGLGDQLISAFSGMFGGDDASAAPVTQPVTQPVAQQTASVQAPPKAGDVVSGYRFKGGDPNDQNNWEPAQ